MGVILDAYALIALMRNEPAAAEVELLLRQGEAAMPAVNLAEALDFLHRRDRVEESRLRGLLEPVIARGLTVLPAAEEHAWRAASLRARYYRRRGGELSLADCFLLAAARPDDRVATADPMVGRVARAEEIDVLALPDSRGRRP